MVNILLDIHEVLSHPFWGEGLVQRKTEKEPFIDCVP